MNNSKELLVYVIIVFFIKKLIFYDNILHVQGKIINVHFTVHTFKITDNNGKAD